MSLSYLTDVTAAQLRWHLSKYVRDLRILIRIFNKYILTEKLTHGALVTPTSGYGQGARPWSSWKDLTEGINLLSYPIIRLVWYLIYVLPYNYGNVFHMSTKPPVSASLSTINLTYCEICWYCPLWIKALTFTSHDALDKNFANKNIVIYQH